MKISVITPSFQQGSFIKETLESVRTAAANCSSEVEHIIFDGGSTDETVDVLKAQSFARWFSEKDEGQTHAINKGLRIASGEILCYLCSDDLLEADALERIETVFAAEPGTDLVYGDYFFLEGRSGWKRLHQVGKHAREKVLAGKNPLSQPATFWRRRVYETWGGFDESLRFCMDHEYWLRIAPHTSWTYVPAPLASMRMHSDAKTSSSLIPAWDEAVHMLQTHQIPTPFLRRHKMRLGGGAYFRLKRKFFETWGCLRPSPGGATPL